MNGDNLPYQFLTVIPFTPITSEWGNGVGDDLLALAAGTGFDDGAVATAKMADGAITPNKMNFGAATAFEATSGTTNSTGYTATLTTGGTNPAVTVNVPTSGTVMVLINARVSNSNAGSLTSVSFALSGSNTVAASDNMRLSYESGNANDIAIFGAHFFLTGLTPGSTTITLQYAVTAGTGTVGLRRLTAVPLGNA